MTYRNTQFGLTGRSVLVTGAGVGIGSAVAEAFAMAGAAVLVADANVSAAARVAERILMNGGRADYVRLDARDPAAADAAAARAARLADGFLHILVNNAGATTPAMLSDLTNGASQWMLDVHLVGAFHCSEAARPYLPTDGTGRIINVVPSARKGAIDRPNRSRTTTGIIGLTQSLAHDLEQQRVLVNAVALPAAPPRPKAIRKNAKFATLMPERNPSPAWTDAEDHAGTFVFLAADAASNLTGQVLPVGDRTVMNIPEAAY